MLLIKCKCGCFFTIKDDALNKSRLRCSNCQNSAEISFGWDLSDLSKELTKTGFTVRSIPDDAKITVAFDA